LRRAPKTISLHIDRATTHPLPEESQSDTMPKFFCDYCDVYLTHDSMSVRKAHNNGRNHLRNVQAYYEQISSDQTQQVINSITDAYNLEGQANPLYQANLSGGFAGGPMGGMGMGGPPMGMPPGGMPGFPPPGKRRCRPVLI
jgi:U1 small nuclear ribonucleoprotein C